MQNLKEVLSVIEENRDFPWEEKFFKALSTSQIKLISETPQQGPDSFPYMLAETVLSSDLETNSEGSIVDFQQIIHWLYTRGIGLVINPRREPNPDYVFSYGMIWSFKKTGYFLQPTPSNSEIEKQVLKKDLIVASPSEDFLPKFVRQILKDFFRDQMVLDPKILILSKDGNNFDLCFSLESLGNPPEKEYDGICEAISWFLPQHYVITLMSEKEFPQFESL